MPIWITPPAKVKKLGVIEKIIMSVFDETGSIDDGIIDGGKNLGSVTVSPGNFDLLVLNNAAKLLAGSEGIIEKQGTKGEEFIRTGTPVSWYKLLDLYPGKFRSGITTIRLMKSDGNEIVATCSLNPTDDTQMVLSIDPDTLPGNSTASVDAIIDPLKFNPNVDGLVAGRKYLILNDIHPTLKNDSSDANMNAWQNADGSIFSASINDIISWDGSNWSITFDASGHDSGVDSAQSPSPVYITNIYTGVQYKYDNGQWTKSFEGEYEAEQWRLVL